jgi:hypothetical protein
MPPSGCRLRALNQRGSARASFLLLRRRSKRPRAGVPPGRSLLGAAAIGFLRPRRPTFPLRERSSAGVARNGKRKGRGSDREGPVVRRAFRRGRTLMSVRRIYLNTAYSAYSLNAPLSMSINSRGASPAAERSLIYDGWQQQSPLVCKRCGYVHKRLIVKPATHWLAHTFANGVIVVDKPQPPLGRPTSPRPASPL